MIGFVRCCLTMMFVAIALWNPAADAQVRMIVGFAPGGLSDVTARVISSVLSRELGAPVIVDNRPGSSGMSGLDILGQSSSENTIGLLSADTVMAVASNRGNQIDLVQGVSIIGISGMVLAVRGGNTISDFAALIQYGRSGALSYGTPGGGILDLCATQFAKSANLRNPTNKSYKSPGLLFMDLVVGQIDFACLPVGMALPQLASGSGKLKALALTLPYPHEKLPGVPTLESLGIQGVPLGQWYMIVAPKAMDRTRVVTLASAMTRTLADNGIRQRLQKFSMDPIPAEDATPEIADRFLRKQISILTP